MDNSQYESEYQYIKKEIGNKNQMIANLLTFTITTTVLIISYAVAENITTLYIVPFFIIIPVSCRAKAYKIDMIKSASYAIVFLEHKGHIK